MRTKESVKRYLLFIGGLFFIALGIAFAKRAELGITPISSVPNILNIRFPEISMGNWLIIWNSTLILGQILILRKNFKIYQLLQLPLSFLFGFFTDFGLLLLSYIPADTYIIRLIMVLLGVVILAFGISLSVVANVIMNSGEAIVKAMSDAWKINFGDIKIIFDVSCVVLSVILSLIFFDFKIMGTREGTVIAAFGVGICVKWFTKRIKVSLENILKR